MALMPDSLTAGPLELRRSMPAHLDALMAAIEMSQPELARFLPWADPMPTAEAERDVLIEMGRAFDADELWAYLLFELDSDELVGGIGLHPKPKDTVEIGYWVRTDRTRRGYATTAAGALTEAAFHHLDIRRVIIRMDQANLASAAVPRKLGFTKIADAQEREIAASGHTGRGWTWELSAPGSAPASR